MNPTHVPDPVRAVAAFDFDGTLTHGDTLLPYLRRVVGARRLARGLASAAWAGRNRSEEGRAAAKEALLRATLEGIPTVELAAAGRAHADELLGSGLRPQLVSRLGEHRARDTESSSSPPVSTSTSSPSPPTSERNSSVAGSGPTPAVAATVDSSDPTSAGMSKQNDSATSSARTFPRSTPTATTSPATPPCSISPTTPT